jgi:phenylpropionate dioxygenase-like ring-hydroxylating dioxygenase large terminal subunit
MAVSRTMQSPGQDKARSNRIAQYFHPVAKASELEDSPLRRTLLGEDIVLFRSEGQAVAFRDLCIHRAARLSLGEVTDEGNLRCGYHGWEYDSEGRCVRIPALPAGTSIPRKARAFRYEAREAYGLIWVALEEPVADIPAFPNGEWDDPARRNFIPINQVWQASAGRAIENFCDVAHFPWLHENKLGSRDDALIEPYDVWSSDTQLGFTWDQKAQPDDLYSSGICRNTYIVTLPFTVHVIRENLESGDHVVLALCASPTTTKTCRLFMLNSRNHTLDPKADAAFMAFAEDLFNEDRTAVESQRPEEIPIDLREELHLKVPDAFSLVYRRLLAEFGEEGEAFLRA